MIGVDTNLLFYALHTGMEDHAKAKALLQQWADSTEVVIAELVLVELYQLLRNQTIMGCNVSAREATKVIQTFRSNPKWIVVEKASVMHQVWEKAGEKHFARRRLFDVRLAFTLQQHGVTHFATANVKDFRKLGFEKVWNPLITSNKI